MTAPRAPAAALGCALSALALAGCAWSRKLVTARHTPCRSSDVTITDHVREGDHETWLAHCHEARYECEAQAVDNDVLYRCRPHP